MSLPEHARFRLELAEVLVKAVALHIRIRECEADQQTHKPLAEHSIPDGIDIDYAEKQHHLEHELQSIMDDLGRKYQETSLSIFEYFYFPGDAKDVAKYAQELIDWISDIRKHLIRLKAETIKMLRDQEKISEYEQRLGDVYHSVVKFERVLKIKFNPPPLLSEIPPESGRIPHFKLHDSSTLTERLDRIRNTLTTFQRSRTEFSTDLLKIHRKYHLESFRPSLSSQFSNAINQTVNSITSESLPLLLSTVKARCQDALAHNEEAFHIYLGQQLHASFGLIQIVLGVTNAALSLETEDGIFDT